MLPFDSTLQSLYNSGYDNSDNSQYDYGMKFIFSLNFLQFVSIFCASCTPGIYTSGSQQLHLVLPNVRKARIKLNLIN